MTVETKRIKLRLDFSFFAFVTLMLLTSEREIVFVCLASSFFHEIGHLSLLYFFGEKKLNLTFAFFGMRIERESVSSLSYKKEAIVSLGGVAVNFLLSALFFCIFKVNLQPIFLVGTFVNIFIASLNLIPAQMLDSWNFLRYILLVYYDEEKTLRVLEKVSNTAVLLFCAFSVFYIAFEKVNLSLIAVCVYLIVLNFK